MTLIAPDQTWALLAILLGAGAFGLWAEQTRWGGQVSGVVVAIGTTFTLSNLAVIPVAAPVYDLVWSYLVPLAIPLLLFKADLRRIAREAGPTLVAFGCGALGTTLGTIVAFAVVPLPAEGWKLAGIFAATYIGGSLNYASAAAALDLTSGDLLTAGIAADNLVMTLYFLLLFGLPSIAVLRRAYPRRRPLAPAAPTSSSPLAAGPMPMTDMMIALAAAAVCCSIGYGVAALMGWGGGGILVLTAVAVAGATAVPHWLGRLAGAQELGTLLMQLFFATIGASANIAVVLGDGAVLFVFAVVILGTHLLFLLGAGAVLRLDLREIVVASNANVGGPTTAAAMAASKGWRDLVIPAILCGTLGYAGATFAGVGLARWLAP